MQFAKYENYWNIWKDRLDFIYFFEIWENSRQFEGTESVANRETPRQKNSAVIVILQWCSQKDAALITDDIKSPINSHFIKDTL